MKFIALTIVALYGLSATFLNAQSVPFVIPGDDSSVSATDFRLLDEPAGAKGFVHVKDGHGTLVLTAWDDQPIAKSKQLLLLASSGAENTGMKCNADRTSLGNQWGTTPTRVNLVCAKLKLALGSKFEIHALDGMGKRISQVEAEFADGKLTFEIGSPHATIWYELVQE